MYNFDSVFDILLFIKVLSCHMCIVINFMIILLPFSLNMHDSKTFLIMGCIFDFTLAESFCNNNVCILMCYIVNHFTHLLSVS